MLLDGVDQFLDSGIADAILHQNDNRVLATVRISMSGGVLAARRQTSAVSIAAVPLRCSPGDIKAFVASEQEGRNMGQFLPRHKP